MATRNQDKSRKLRFLKLHAISLVLLLSLFIVPLSWANIHIIYDSELSSPNGAVNLSLYDSLSWLGPRCWYGSGTQYMGESPVAGSMLCDSPDDEVGELYAAAEIGIDPEGGPYIKAYAESSDSVNPYWGYPVSCGALGAGTLWFTLDSGPLSLHWVSEGFAGYEIVNWTIELKKLIFTPEGVHSELVFSTDNHPGAAGGNRNH